MGAEARPLGEEALQIYRSLDARRDSIRTQLRFRATGLRTGAQTKGGAERVRPKIGWESLTQAEVAVAVQVAQGLSNLEIARRLFISRRTVQTHVSHALNKLGMFSRVEIAVEACRRGAAT
jgi:DNA-binding NarL/FixJ family response regulator